MEWDKGVLNFCNGNTVILLFWISQKEPLLCQVDRPAIQAERNDGKFRW